MLPTLPPLPDSLQDRILHTLQQAFAYRPEDWQPLLLNGKALGCIDAVWHERLRQDWTGRLKTHENGLHLESGGWQEMADLLGAAARRWYDAGWLTVWRDEVFDVRDHGGSGVVLFRLERSAFRPLGFYAQAVHINGLAETAEGWCFWLARRSPQKAIDPGKLDNLAAGGIGAGESPAESMRRECWEEAGLPPELLDTAAPAGRIISLHAVKRGLHRESLYLYDIILPDGFTPQNQDGEVSAFAAMDAHAVADAVIRGEMTNDAALVTLDLFRRCGLLSPQHPLTAYLRSTRLQTAV